MNPEHAAGTALGDRFLFDGRRAPARPLDGPRSCEVPISAIRPLDDRPRPRVERGIAFLPSLPRVRLVIVGAGHVGQAVAGLAAQADFDVWVVDDRQQYANAERFPQAQRILVGPIDEVLGSLEVTPRTYALIVTRGHGHDQEALYHLAPTPRLLRRADRQPPQDPADLRGPARAGARRGRPRARGRAGRPGHRLAERRRDRDQHRGRTDRPAQPRPAGPGRPIPTPRGRTHDRRRRARRRPERPHGPAQAAAWISTASRSSTAS